MKHIFRTISALSLAAVATVGVASISDSALAQRAARTARAAVNHATHIALGEGGSHIIGNPAARVQVTEYVSYTCSHCAHFSETSSQPLTTRYVAPGRVKVEIRHLVRDPIDMAMAVAANCGPQTGFYRRHTALMGQQTAILARAQALPDATIEQWRNLPLERRLQRVADDLGISAWMRGQGLTAAQANACLGDTALQQRLMTMTNGAIAAGVAGTPSFAINGQLQPSVHDWPTLATALDRAIATR